MSEAIGADWIGAPKPLRHIIESGMQRVDLYIKVEIELDEKEKPERVAAEICRQIEKMYVVRSAEVSNSIKHE